MASFNEIVDAINSGRAVVKPLPYDPNEEGRVYADYGVYIDGKLVPNTNDRTVLPVNFKQVIDPATNEYVNDYTQPQEIRLRERTGGSQFKDVNMAYDTKTGAVAPPKANQFYTSGSKDSGFGIGGFLGDLGSLASSASPVLTGIAGAYFGPMVAEAIGGASAVPPENPFLSGMAGENAISGAGVAGSTGGSYGAGVAGAANAAPFVNPTNITTPISQIGNQIPGSLGTGTYNSIPDLSSSVLTPPADVGQLTGGAPMTAGSFSPAATGAMGAGLGGAATDAMGNIIPAAGGAAAGTAAAAIASGAVPAGIGTSLTDLLTPSTALIGKGILDTLGSNKTIAGINSAAATQQAAYEQSKKDLAGLYANQQGYQKPYMATGTGALSNLGALGTGTYQMYDAQGNPTGTGTGSGYLQHQFDASDLAKGLAPNYDFMLQQGQMANQRAANMAGGGFGGNALQGLNKYTQDYAGNAYQNAFTNYQNQRQNIFGNLSNLAGIGQGAANQLTNATGAYGTNLTNLNVGNAAAQAAAQVAAAQQSGTNLSNLGNTAVVASLLGQNPGIAQTPVA
jgi:hypothetical protein